MTVDLWISLSESCVPKEETMIKAVMEIILIELHHPWIQTLLVEQEIIIGDLSPEPLAMILAKYLIHLQPLLAVDTSTLLNVMLKTQTFKEYSNREFQLLTTIFSADLSLRFKTNSIRDLKDLLLDWYSRFKICPL